jgi:PAS domain S-box-containing protein
VKAPKQLIELQQENAELRERLAEAESVLQAIRHGEVDAVVVNDPQGERVFTLQGADHPYRMLIESMNEGAATLTADGVVLYSNRRLATLLGSTTPQVIGMPLASWFATEDEGELHDMLRASQAESVSRELTARRADSRTVPVQLSLSPLTLQGVKLRCAIVTDISLAKHQAALEASAQENRAANDRLREADRHKDEFLATLAHELRNPLAPIRAAAHVIKVLNLDDARLAKAQRMIERQVTHIARLVDDLMELSRITLGRIELQRRTESLAEVLTSVADAAQPSIEAAQHLFTVELPDEPLLVLADSVRLSQAIGNVLENAVKYTPLGGRIVLSARREAESAVIRIEDNGIGIAPEMLVRVFDMFVQVDHSGQRGGLGIGLALSRRLVEMHGGSIAVSSAGTGQGTAFTIRIPLRPEASLEAMTERGDTLPAAPSRRVLVVDDNTDAAESLKMLLELSGHIVKTEYRGGTALQAMELFRPDVVLLDIGLPDLDGYEVARRIGAQYGARRPTVIALSGWGQASDKRRAADAGIDAHYTKPIDPGVLARLFATRVTDTTSSRAADGNSQNQG